MDYSMKEILRLQDELKEIIEYTKELHDLTYLSVESYRISIDTEYVTCQLWINEETPIVKAICDPGSMPENYEEFTAHKNKVDADTERLTKLALQFKEEIEEYNDSTF